QRWTVDGVFVLRSVGAEPFARHVHDPRPYRARPAAGIALCLSRLLDRGLEEDGLQGSVPATAAAGPLGLAAHRCGQRSTFGTAGLAEPSAISVERPGRTPSH